MPVTDNGGTTQGERQAAKSAGSITGVDEVTRWHNENVIWASGEHDPGVNPDQAISGTERVQSWEP